MHMNLINSNDLSYPNRVISNHMISVDMSIPIYIDVVVRNHPGIIPTLYIHSTIALFRQPDRQ